MSKRSVIRAVLSFLLIALLFTELVSCTQINTQSPTNKTTAESQPSDTETPSIDESTPGTDTIDNPYGDRFSGETVNLAVILSRYDANSAIRKNGADVDPVFSAYTDALNERYKEVEDLLGVTIHIEYKTDEEVFNSGNRWYEDELRASELSGYDAVIIPKDRVFTLINCENIQSPRRRCSDGYADMCAESPYWNISAKTMARDVDFGCWLLTGYAVPEYYENMYCTFVDRNIWNQYSERISKLPSSGGFGDLYEIVDNGYWTLDLWLEISELFQSENAEMTAVKGNHDGWATAQYYLLGYGAQVTETVQYNEPYPAKRLSLVNDRTMSYMEKMHALTSLNNCDVKRLDDHTMISFGLMYEAALQDPSDDLCILPLPKFDKEQKNYTTNSRSHFMFFSFDENASKEERDRRLELTEAVMDLLAQVSYQKTAPVFFNLLTNDEYGKEGDEFRMIQYVLNGCVFDVHDGFVDQMGERNICYLLYMGAVGLPLPMEHEKKRLEDYLGSYISDMLNRYNQSAHTSIDP